MLIVPLFAVATGCGDGGHESGGSGPGTDFEQDCLVSFGITSEIEIATLEAWIDYGRTGGRFVGGGSDVACERLDDRWAVWSVNQCREPDGACGEGDVPELALIGRATHDISTPAGLATCRFVGNRIPTDDELRVRVAVATDEDLRAVSPVPVVEITAIECRSGTSTTSTTVATIDPCDEVACPDTHACVEGVCRSTDH